MEKIFIVKEFYLNENTCERCAIAKPFRKYDKAKEYFDKEVAHEKERIAKYYGVDSFEEVLEEVLCDEKEFIVDDEKEFGGYFGSCCTIEIDLVEEILK